MIVSDECSCERRETPLLDSLNTAVEAADHLGDLDEPTIEAARALARKIDMADLYFEKLVEYAADNDSRPPSPDNVSLPTYLRYCDALGLTPVARLKLKEKPKEGGAGGKLGQLRGVASGKAA